MVRTPTEWECAERDLRRLVARDFGATVRELGEALLRDGSPEALEQFRELCEAFQGGDTVDGEGHDEVR